MRLREKTLIVIVVIFATLILIEFAFSNLIVMNSYYSMEREDTLQKVYQADGALAKEFQSIDVLLSDWAARDDSYRYMAYPSPGYIEQNMRDEAFVSRNLNLLLMIDTSGQIAYSKAFDLKNRTVLPLWESVRPHVGNGSPLVLQSANESLSGVIVLPEGPMLVVAQPILDSERKGPARGTMIMGRFVDAEWSAKLSETTRLDLSVYLFDSPDLPADILAVRNASYSEYPYLTIPLNEDYIGGYQVIEDVDGKPALVMRVLAPRPIYQNGKDTIAYIILVTLAVGVLIAALAIVLLEKIVLSRISRLDREVKMISASNDLSARVAVAGQDELSNLAKAINHMLSSLEQSGQKLYQSENRYHAIVEDQSELICRFRPDGAIVFANEAYCRYFAAGQPSAPEKCFIQSLPPVTREGAEGLLQSLNAREPARILECLFEVNGEQRWLQWNIRAICDREGRVTEFQAVGRDVTEIIRNQEQIKASLREKEALLKEVHHRVKNNLQIISSILSLQEARVIDQPSREMLRDSRNRIKSMALIHEKLYRSENLSRINFAEYVRSLMSHILTTYGSGGDRINVRVDVEDISLNIDTAIPLGLIINELVTNSFKHAFPGGAGGEISVELHRDGAGQYLLTVGDDGAGMPGDFDVEHTTSLGLQLVNALVQQTNSKVTILREKGTVFKIAFSA
ncbi:MAG: nitrate/nitrite sensor protein NarQ [Methanocella sp. PtaU1.Bin125]|nr:MAG: nitrate/nitrite sensor protein NarQ [Methanocella sp. PtaU1.Bin125]